MGLDIQNIDTLFLWRLAITAVFSFLIGLELHQYQRAEGQGIGFGTTRTLTLVGITGFLLYVLDTGGWLFVLGFIVFAFWLGLYYRRRLEEGYQSLIAPVVCLLVYLLGLLSWKTPPWFVAAFVVIILFFLNAKPRIRAFADTVSGAELATVAKFVIMAGIVLPLLPERQIASFIPVTFRDTWLAVVAVSGISYLSYVAQTYVFKARGVLVAGLLGGLYSSTATTFALSKGARAAAGDSLVSPALILATAMMYVRLLAVATLLAPDHVGALAAPFLTAALASGLLALVLVRFRKHPDDTPGPRPDQHPLEFQAALLFAALFVLFVTATGFVANRYNDVGLDILAFFTGVTDVDPFVLSVLTGHIEVQTDTIIKVVIIATASNNLFKAVLAWFLARNRTVLPAAIWLVAVALVSLLYVVL